MVSVSVKGGWIQRTEMQLLALQNCVSVNSWKWWTNPKTWVQLTPLNELRPFPLLRIYLVSFEFIVYPNECFIFAD